MNTAPRKYFFYLIAAIAVFVAPEADAEVLKGYPDAIVCRVGDSLIISYLAGVKDDSSALYKPPVAEFYINTRSHFSS